MVSLQMISLTLNFVQRRIHNHYNCLLFIYSAIMENNDAENDRHALIYCGFQTGEQKLRNEPCRRWP